MPTIPHRQWARLSPENRARLAAFVEQQFANSYHWATAFSKPARTFNPLHFSLLAGLIMLLLLSFMPHHPLTIPATFGSGISISLLFTTIRDVLSKMR